MSTDRPARLRVLIADDYPDVADSLAFVLQAHGYEIRVARDGIEAVSSAVAFQPDVILLDIGMPKLDGYAAACRIRQQLGTDVMLIALTAWAREEDKQRAQAAGFDLHVAKPPDLGMLTKLLEELGTRKQPHPD